MKRNKTNSIFGSNYFASVPFKTDNFSLNNDISINMKIKMVYPFQHNNALEQANPRRGASGAVWRGSRKATARKLAAFREPHAKPCSQARKSRCARFSMLRAPARLNSSTAATSPRTRSGSRLSAALYEHDFVV